MKQKYWFAAKKYGWGWYPSAWQGWFVLVVYVLDIIIVFKSLYWRTGSAGEAITGMVLPFLVLTLFFAIILRAKGEEPGWRWGGSKISFRYNFLVIPLITLLVSGIGGALTSSGMEWYQTINLPSFTPDGGIIGLIWTLLFILATASALIFYNHSKAKKDKHFYWIILIFLLNGLLNVFWSYLFFANNLLYAAVWEAALLGGSILALIILLWPISRVASILLWPYLGWVMFAIYLTWSVAKLN